MHSAALPAESNAGLQASTSDSKQAAQEVEEQGPSPKAGDDSLYETPGHLSAISEREAEAEAVRTPSARTGGRSSDLSGTPLHTPGSATPAGACGSLLAKERVERGEGRRSGRGDAVRESRDSSSEGLSSPGDVFGMHDGVFSGHLREGQGAHEVETQSPAVLFYVWAVGPLLAVVSVPPVGPGRITFQADG